MLGEVLKKYETYKKNSLKYLQQTKQKLEEQLQAKTIQALKIQNHKVSKIHSNQQDIENRLRRNSDLQAQLKVHLGGWLNKTLKEAGDVVNYAQYVEEEVRQINQQLQQRMKDQIANQKIVMGTQSIQPSPSQDTNDKEPIKNDQDIKVVEQEPQKQQQKVVQPLNNQQQSISTQTKDKEQHSEAINQQFQTTYKSETLNKQQISETQVQHDK